MIGKLLITLAFFSNSWAVEEWKKDKGDDVNAHLARNLTDILTGDDEIEDGQSKHQLSRNISAQDFYNALHRGKKSPVDDDSDEEESSDSSPYLTSRLARDIEAVHNSSDSDDELYAREMEQVRQSIEEEQKMIAKSKLYDYLARELWKINQTDERSFSRYAITVGQLLRTIEINICDSVRLLRTIEINICDSVRLIKDLLISHRDDSISEFEKKAKLEIFRRRKGISTLYEENSDFVCSCTALIFKFYGKELFARLIQVSSDQKVYGEYGKTEPALTEDLSSEEDYYHHATFDNLEVWYSFQMKTMAIFELFMNDLCGLNLGGINDIRIRLQEVAIDSLKMYFELNLLYLTNWYDANRSVFSKALSTTGAKSSYTVQMFHNFVDNYKARFCRLKFAQQQIGVDEDDIDQFVKTYEAKFKASDEKFSKGISDSIGSVTSSISSFVPSSWGSWWSSSSK